MLNKKIGILGGGQLGKMLCQDASKLGIRLHILEKDNRFPAAGIAEAIIDNSILAQDNTLGRFYVLAPENACSAPEFDITNFEEIWQYGSNEELDLKWEQDGVAPQCAIPRIVQGLQSKFGRVFIPDGQIKEFAGSHLSENYLWIFDIESPQGLVKSR